MCPPSAAPTFLMRCSSSRRARAALSCSRACWLSSAWPAAAAAALGGRPAPRSAGPSCWQQGGAGVGSQAGLLGVRRSVVGKLWRHGFCPLLAACLTGGLQRRLRPHSVAKALQQPWTPRLPAGQPRRRHLQALHLCSLGDLHLKKLFGLCTAARSRRRIHWDAAAALTSAHWWAGMRVRPLTRALILQPDWGAVRVPSCTNDHTSLGRPRPSTARPGGRPRAWPPRAPAPRARLYSSRPAAGPGP